jgi:hypothetical protein
MEDVILWVESSGLGDHLIYSTLPELFARRGHRVYVSNSTPTRNDEVRSLLYDENPFVAGWTDTPPNAGTGRVGDDLIHGIRLASIIEWVELGHGLPVTNRYPLIYYQPRFRPDLRDVVLVDPRSTSQPFPSDRFEWFVDRLGFPHDQLRVVWSKHSGLHGVNTLSGSVRIEAASLHEYIDMIYSCLAYVGTESGGTALASAIRQDRKTPELYALTTTKSWNHRVYVFPNVTYMVISGLQSDW